MPPKGPQKLTSEQLRSRGSRSDIVKRREAEEGKTAQRLALVASREPAVMPLGLHGTAAALWISTVADYAMDAQAEALFCQALHSLSRAETARELIASDGLMIDGKPHGLCKVEHDARLAFHKLMNQLHFFEE